MGSKGYIISSLYTYMFMVDLTVKVVGLVSNTTYRTKTID